MDEPKRAKVPANEIKPGRIRHESSPQEFRNRSRQCIDSSGATLD